MLRWLCVTRRSAVYVSSFKNFYYTLIYTYIHINILYIPHIRTRSILLSPAVLRPVQNHQHKDEPPLSLCQRYINWVLTKISHRIRDQVSMDIFPELEMLYQKQYSNCCRQVITYMNHIQCNLFSRSIYSLFVHKRVVWKFFFCVYIIHFRSIKWKVRTWTD